MASSRSEPSAHTPGPAPPGPAFWALFQAGFEPRLLVDEDARIVHANDAARQALACSPGGSALDLAAPEADADVRAWWHADGRERARRRIPLRAGGSVAVLVAQDVAPGLHLWTFEPPARAALPRREELAETERLAALGTLVSGVAHEIRTPLTFIVNNAFLLERAIESSVEEGDATRALMERVRPHLRDVLTGADRINHLVLELRRFAQRKASVRVALPLDEAVDGAIELFRATNRMRGRLDVRLGRTPPVVLDVVGIQQIVLNLLDNAADASPTDGTILLATRATDDSVELIVEDEGAGVEPHLHERVFEPFFTTKPHGTGLGLSIVKRIVDAHRGRVLVERGPQGARFRVVLPLTSAEPRPGRGAGSG